MLPFVSPRCFSLIILAAHLPLVSLHLLHLWESGRYTHSPAILVVSLLMSLRQFRRQATGDGQFAARSRTLERFGTVGGLAFGFLALAVAVAIWSPWLAYLAFLMSLLGVGCVHGRLRIDLHNGNDVARAWLLLWLLVPLPMGFDGHLSKQLQIGSSVAASTILDFVHVRHLRQGNVLETPGMEYSVAEACSGISTLYSSVAAAAVLALVVRRHGWMHSGLLIVAAVAWSVAGNATRVAGIVIAGRYGLDLARGWAHETFGLSLFAITLLLILSTDQISVVAFAPTQQPPYVDYYSEWRRTLSDVSVPTLPSNATVARRPLQVLSGLFVCLGFLQLVPTIAASRPEVLTRGPLPTIEETTLPDELVGWRRTKFAMEWRGAGHREGERSAVWHFEKSGREAIVSFDFPFADYHPLTACYRGRGCRVLDWQAVVDAALAPQPVLAAAVLELEDRRRAELVFVEWTSDGTWLEPTSTEDFSWSRLVCGVRHRVTSWNPCLGTRSSVYQLQVLSTQPGDRDGAPASDELPATSSGVHQLLRECVPYFRQLVLGERGRE